MRYFDRAALFVEACLKYGAFEVNDDTNILFSEILSLLIKSPHLTWCSGKLSSCTNFRIIYYK